MAHSENVCKVGREVAEAVTNRTQRMKRHSNTAMWGRGGFGGGFGVVWGSFWEFLGYHLAARKAVRYEERLQELPRSVLGSFWEEFGVVVGSSWELWGHHLGGGKAFWTGRVAPGPSSEPPRERQNRLRAPEREVEKAYEHKNVKS